MFVFSEGLLLTFRRDHTNLAVYLLSKRWTWKSEKCSLKISVNIAVVRVTFLFSTCNCSSLFAMELILPFFMTMGAWLF